RDSAWLSSAQGRLVIWTTAPCTGPATPKRAPRRGRRRKDWACARKVSTMASKLAAWVASKRWRCTMFSAPAASRSARPSRVLVPPLSAHKIMAVSCHRARQPALRQFHPECRAHGDQAVVEVIAGVVQHARPQAVAAFPVRAIAVADDKVGAGLDLKKKAEIFGAHGGFELVGVLLAHELLHDRADKVGFQRVVHRGRVVALELELGAGPEGGRQLIGHLAHA